MKTLYLECSMGAAGDMLTAALMDLLPQERQTYVLDTLNHMGLDDVTVKKEREATCGIMGTHMHVLIHGEEEHQHDDHACDHEYDHDHEHPHDHHEGHDHDHAHPHDHHDGHDHDHAHLEEHDHGHDHDHNHEHDGHGHEHHHHHASPGQIQDIIAALDIPGEVRRDVLAVYQSIAEAEAHAHGMPVDQIHFHEVGTKDAIADITAVCLLIHEIGAEQIIASPVNVGNGHVHCAHGVLPVPAPATEYLLRGIPSYQPQRQMGELCTPTGAALLRHFVQAFIPRPMMTVEKTGYGVGEKEFTDPPVANCVRAFLGDAAPIHSTEYDGSADEIILLQTNIDDMTGEELGYAMDRLFEEGARDVYLTPVYMKKNRPATMLSVITDTEHEEHMSQVIFKETSTIGLRVIPCRRHIMPRSSSVLQTPDGEVRVKISSGCGTERRKAEFDDLADIARRTGRSIAQVRQSLNL